MRRLCVILAASLLMLVGCTQQRLTVENGEVLSPEEQQSLYQERAEQSSEPLIGGKYKVYWTETGSKYHKDPSCSYLKNAKTLQSGTVAEAANHGASEPCSRCGGKKS